MFCVIHFWKLRLHAHIIAGFIADTNTLLAPEDKLHLNLLAMAGRLQSLF